MQACLEFLYSTTVAGGISNVAAASQVEQVKRSVVVAMVRMRGISKRFVDQVEVVF